MAKIKHTKNELKTQSEALKRFRRFLPMLQLKKQQLQMEIQSITAKIEAKSSESDKIKGQLNQWVKLFGDNVDISNFVKLQSVNYEEGNIAGVNIPVLLNADILKAEYDLFETPTWVDDAVDTISQLIQLRVEQEVLEEQRRLVTEELRTTSQRVNLFEKVKIPECKEHIRIIKIFLGDEQTASVVRGKIAKNRVS